MTPETRPPRSATPSGYRNIARVVREGLCHRCGVCGGICPRQAVVFDDRALPRVTADCNGCGLCVRTCSGWRYLPPERQPFGPHGQGFLCASADTARRREAASGGLVTALLCHLLDSRAVAGVVVTEADPRAPWRPRAVLATDPQRVRRARQSKYCLFPWGNVLREVMESSRPFAAVGLACHIQSLRLAARALPRLGRKLHLAVGLCCETNVEPDGIRHLLERHRLAPDRLAGIDYRSGAWPGVMRARLRDGRRRQLSNRTGDRGADYTSINWLKLTYGQPRCRLCPDVTNATADITAGDPWIRSAPGGYYRGEGGPGWTATAVRSRRALECIRQMRASGRILCRREPVEKLFALQIGQSRATRLRLQPVMERRRGKGRPVVRDLPVPDGAGPSRPGFAGRRLRDLPLVQSTFFRRFFLSLIFSRFGDRLTRLNGWRRRRAWLLRKRLRGAGRCGP